MQTAQLPANEVERLAALRRTNLLDSEPDPDFDDIARLASVICGTPIALVSLVDEQRQWFKARVGLDATETPRDVAFCAHAILDDQVFEVPDAHIDPRFHDNPLVTGGPRVRFYAGAPLVTADGLALGTLCVIDHDPRMLSDAQRESLAALSRQVVAQVRLHDRNEVLARHAREMQVVNEFAEFLQSCRTTDEAHEVVALYAPRLFPDARGAIGVTDPSRSAVEVAATWGEATATEEVFPPDDCWALRRGRTHHVPGGGGVLGCRHARDASGYVCIPMVAEGETLGMLHLSDVGDPDGGAAQRQLAALTAERVALALANIRLRETLRAQSVRDPLTGLFNRRYLEETLEREVRRCARAARPLAVLVFDVDHFKRFNDEFGHDGGDALLQSFGAMLRRVVRAEDVVCRYGGEEFVAVLAECDAALAMRRAEEMREATRALRVVHRGAQLGVVTVSIGVANLGSHGRRSADLVRAADSALYRAKSAGRDRVVVADAAADAAA